MTSRASRECGGGVTPQQRPDGLCRVIIPPFPPAAQPCPHPECCNIAVLGPRVLRLWWRLPNARRTLRACGGGGGDGADALARARAAARAHASTGGPACARVPVPVPVSVSVSVSVRVCASVPVCLRLCHRRSVSVSVSVSVCARACARVAWPHAARAFRSHGHLGPMVCAPDLGFRTARVCVRACARARARACVRAFARACVRAGARWGRGSRRRRAPGWSGPRVVAPLVPRFPTGWSGP